MSFRILETSIVALTTFSLTITLSLAMPGASLAADIFVNNRLGADSNDGTAAEAEGGRHGPCATITTALRRVQAGDRIILAKTGRPYRESITLHGGNNSGTALGSFVLQGNGAVLDGSAEVPKGQWKHARDSIFRFQPRRLHHQQLFLDDVPAKRRQIDPKAKQLPDLKPREWCIYQQAIYFCAGRGKIPENYSIRYAVLPVGITLFEVHDVVITNLTVQGFQLDGVNAHDGVTDCLLENLRCRGNGRSGVSIGGASRVKVSACLIGSNGIVQLRAEGYSIAKATDCDLIDDADAPASQSFGGARLFIDGKKVETAKE